MKELVEVMAKALVDAPEEVAPTKRRRAYFCYRAEGG
jgi:predicted RNA-binding protein YlqC (UPF0109 family)